MNAQNIAQGLLDCLQAYGERKSNPVLSLLTGVQPVSEQKYPAEAIEFGNGKWRTFYHCHDAPGRSEAEHGHFHIYVSIRDRESGSFRWAHLLGLAMDRQGQPLHWFAVNRWVTDGPWLDRAGFSSLLEDLSTQQESELIARWFSSLLCLYHEELLHVLMARDDRLEILCHGRNREEIFMNREIYKLAESNINMLEKLMSVLSEESKGIA